MKARMRMAGCLSGLLSVVLISVAAPAGTGRADLVQNTVEIYLQTNRKAGNEPNSLIDQVSPYLLQHAYNPVKWYPWGEEAFALARRQDKPVFLSIGYSTCHWCHVMAHESFENEAIAAILNKHFIAVKVDREERPDIDDVYMAATQLVNGYGGWPMTVFLNHELQPFHAGVYYPPVTTDGNLGLTELLLKVVDLWRDDRDRIDKVAARITSQIKAGADETLPGVELDADVRQRAMAQIGAMYDADFGGFGSAPKFPRPGLFAFLLDVAATDGKHAPSALSMVRDTLIAMAQGGIYDHVGGGFHRYAVDAQWQVPHFEKMLYTQALMALAYARLYQLEPDPRYLDIATATLDFVLREMRHAEGGFFSALDASSERPGKAGVRAEGAYYLWPAQQLRALLSDSEWDLAQRYYAIAADGNIDSDPQGEFEQLNILHVSESFRDRALSEKESATLESARRKLYQARLKRPRPHLDDKIITAWNGMMIAALAEAAAVFDDESYLDAAIQAAGFLRDHLVDAKSGQLLRRSRDREVGIAATLGDYAWYVKGLLSLHRHTGDREWLVLAKSITQWQIELFYDSSAGGFFESGPDKQVLFRSRTVYDGALPAPNAVAVENLFVLAGLTGDRRWRQTAIATQRSFAGSINSDPAAAAWMLTQVGKAGDSEQGIDRP